jgi:hypothetical protein
VAVLLWNECRVRHPYVDEMGHNCFSDMTFTLITSEYFTWHLHLEILAFFRHVIYIDDISVFHMTLRNNTDVINVDSMLSTLMSFPKNMSSHVSNKVFQCYSSVLYHIVKNVAVLPCHLHWWHQCISHDIYIYKHQCFSDMTYTLMTSVYFHMTSTFMISVFFRHDIYIYLTS